MNKTTQCSCQSCDCGNKSEARKNLVISWQRLTSDGSTCPRCGTTEDELNKAVLQLKEKLQPQGIDVVLKKEELTLEEFKQNPLMSNRITFNGQSFEELLNAKEGHSKCCDVCGNEECRTVEAGGSNYETIPAELIIEAGIKAIS